MEKFIGIAIIIATVLLASAVVKKLFENILKKTKLQPQKAGVLRVVKKVLLWIIYIIGVILITSYFPRLNTMITSLLAGSGVAALVVSIASQDAISNFVSGIIIIFTKPFQIGDIIRYLDTDITGVVVEIKIRHTIIRTFENKRLIIPNSVINQTPLENMTYDGDNKLCMFLTVNVTYESDINKAMVILAAVIEKHPDFLDPRTNEEKENRVPPVRVRIIDFSDSGIRLKAWVWAKDADIAIDMKNDILLELKKRYDSSGIDFAYPHVQVVHSESRALASKNVR